MNSKATQIGEKAKKIISILKKSYPNAKIVLNYSNPWELVVAVILSAQCTDLMVNKVTGRLFRKYKTLTDYANANLEEFEQDIKSTGFYRNKAKNILNTAKIILKKYNAVIPNKMEQLLELPGVARKTANIILGNVYNIIEGIAVDTHVLRISQRLRLVDLKSIGPGKKKVIVESRGVASPEQSRRIDYFKDADAVKVEKQLMNIIPKSDWFKFTYLIIDHGRAICKAQNPKCEICPLNKLCPVSRV